MLSKLVLLYTTNTVIVFVEEITIQTIKLTIQMILVFFLVDWVRTISLLGLDSVTE